MNELQEEQLMAISSNQSVISVIANADTVDLPPSDPKLSSTHSLEDTSDNLEELEAEMMRLRAEHERVEKQHKVAMLKAEIARSRVEIKAKQVATAELMSSAKHLVVGRLKTKFFSSADERRHRCGSLPRTCRFYYLQLEYLYPGLAEIGLPSVDLFV